MNPKRRLVIAVSGTPGTGKSVFARALADELDAKLIDLNALIEEKKIFRLDSEGTKVANMRRMREEFLKVLKGLKGPVVVEGLLSHLLPTRSLSHVVVLRTDPEVLKRRLGARGYSEKKTRENVEAEALDIILWEAVQQHGMEKVYEIEMTKLKPKDAVKLFFDALKGKTSLRPGRISWLEKFLRSPPADG